MKFTREKLFSVKSGEYIEPCINIYSDEQEKVSKLKRAKKTKATEPKVKKLNDEYSRQYFRLLLNGNFGQGDYQMFLSYDEEHRPADRKAAIKDRQKFVARLRTLYKKHGIEFKNLAITETGVKSGFLHHHLVVPGGIDPKPHRGEVGKRDRQLQTFAKEIGQVAERFRHISHEIAVQCRKG